MASISSLLADARERDDCPDLNPENSSSRNWLLHYVVDAQGGGSFVEFFANRTDGHRENFPQFTCFMMKEYGSALFLQLPSGNYVNWTYDGHPNSSQIHQVSPHGSWSDVYVPSGEINAWLIRRYNKFLDLVAASSAIPTRRYPSRRFRN